MNSNVNHVSGSVITILQDGLTNEELQSGYFPKQVYQHFTFSQHPSYGNCLFCLSAGPFNQTCQNCRNEGLDRNDNEDCMFQFYPIFADTTNLMMINPFLLSTICAAETTYISTPLPKSWYYGCHFKKNTLSHFRFEHICEKLSIHNQFTFDMLNQGLYDIGVAKKCFRIQTEILKCASDLSNMIDDIIMDRIII